MKLCGITLSNFRSFRQPQTIDLRDLPPGLYHVQGVNDAEPELEGNAAGKSTLFDAPYWALFGKTSRNLRAGALRSWGMGGTIEVGVEFDTHAVQRTWSPNALTLDGNPVDQPTLEQQLGLTPDVALNTFYFAQFSRFFLDLPPHERMALYSDVLNLELWERKSERAKELARVAAQGAQELEVQRAKQASVLEELEGTSFALVMEQWTAQQSQKIAGAKEALRTVQDSIADLTAQRANLQKELTRAQKQEKLAAVQARRLNEAYQQAVMDGAGLRAQLEVTKQKREALKVALSRFRRLGSGACELCGQKVTTQHAARHVETLTEQIEEQKERQATQEALVKKSEAAIAKAKRAEEAEREDAPTLRIELDKQLAKTQAQLDSASREQRLAEQRLAALRKEVNPFAQRELERRQRLKSLRESVEGLDRELVELRGVQSRVEFWVGGFKDVRFQVIQESLAQLNTEVNECLHDLGLRDWLMEFSVERETKSGTVKRGFLCDVHSPSSTEGVPWEAWCGGETQRLRLAAQLGVSDMLCSRIGQQFDFEFWDEPSNWLSPRGIEGMLEVLEQRAHEYGRRIFLADHRSFAFPFAGVLRVTKTDEGSSVEIEL